MIGRVKWFNDEKGWGFIIPPDKSQQEAFVHYSQIVGQKGRRTLTGGELVQYEESEGPRGMMALNVERVSQ